MKTPYAYGVDLSVARELKQGYSFEVAYVGRLGHDLLQEVDLAQPLNITDPKSGMTYYQAATELVKLAQKNTPETNVPNLSYRQDLFPSAAGSAGISGYAPGIPASPTATQNIYDLFYSYGNNAIGALQLLDTTWFPGCSNFQARVLLPLTTTSIWNLPRFTPGKR